MQVVSDKEGTIVGLLGASPGRGSKIHVGVFFLKGYCFGLGRKKGKGDLWEAYRRIIQIPLVLVQLYMTVCP